MTFKPLICALSAAITVAGCAPNGTVSSNNVDPISLAKAPPGAAPGTCWHKTVTPAVVKTVNNRVLVQPAQVSSDGRVQAPPIYRTEELAQVIEPRRESWHEIVCATAFTTEFTSTVQRALAARGYYAGPITGEIDRATLTAIRRFQKDEGIDSPPMSATAAKRLGLVVVGAPDAA